MYGAQAGFPNGGTSESSGGLESSSDGSGRCEPGGPRWQISAMTNSLGPPNCLKKFGKSAVCFWVLFPRIVDSYPTLRPRPAESNAEEYQWSKRTTRPPRQKSGGRARVRSRQSPTPAMPLIYAFVARGTTVLAEHTSHSGNFATVAAEVRALLPPFCDVVAFYLRSPGAREPRRGNAGATRSPLHPRSPPLTGASSARSARATRETTR